MNIFSKFFTKGSAGTLRIAPGASFSQRGERVPVYENTEIDKWYVGDFSSATYLLTAEYDSNSKETFQLSVVARPEKASYVVYGRVSTGDSLIDVSVTVNSSWVSVIANPASVGYTGTRVSIVALYTEAMNQLSVPPT